MIIPNYKTIVNSNKSVFFLLYTKQYNMPFKKGTNGNPIGRPKPGYILNIVALPTDTLVVPLGE